METIDDLTWYCDALKKSPYNESVSGVARQGLTNHGRGAVVVTLTNEELRLRSVQDVDLKVAYAPGLIVHQMENSVLEKAVTDYDPVNQFVLTVMCVTQEKAMLSSATVNFL